MLGVVIGLVLLGQATPAPPIEPGREPNLHVFVLDKSKHPGPLPGAAIVISRDGQPDVQVVTSAAGTCDLTLPPGEYTVTVSLRGLKTQSRKGVVVRDRPKGASAVVVEFRMEMLGSAETVLIDDTCAFDHLGELGSWRICAHELERLPGY